MKIITWNVNGLRAIWRKGALQELIQKENPDIVGIQETKSLFEQLKDETADEFGYFSFFESATNRKGYSGVAIYSKENPKDVKSILGNILKLTEEEFLDNEGRFIMAEYPKFYLLNCYWPNGGKSPEHFLYKLEYYKKFLTLAKELEKTKPVIFMGDINATVSDLDLARPKENAGELGCTPEERLELSKYCESFTDVWRENNPYKQEYTWWDMKTRARERNVGWRIDYIFISKVLKDKVKSIKILGDHFGSDHCPVVLEIDL
jgi:exodeoxyribonuclease III